MKYIMITSWDNHWDKIHSTYYTKNMLREGMTESLLEENTETIFIKIDTIKKEPEKTWSGKVKNLKIEGEKIRFDVIIEREIPIPEEYKRKTVGRYVTGKEISFETQSTHEMLVLYPPFFYILQETKDWNLFEYYVYLLLKLIGINNIYKYERQKGLPDGFFKFNRLAVLYDCTLEKDFEKSKKQQIQNFCDQLQKDEISLGEKIRIPIKNCIKEVWIITKGQSKLITRTGEITVKEISISSLFQIFHSRLRKISDEEGLEEELKIIGK